MNISHCWRLYGGCDVCSRTTFSAVVHGSYAAMGSPLAQDILSFVEGYLYPERFGF